MVTRDLLARIPPRLHFFLRNVQRLHKEKKSLRMFSLILDNPCWKKNQTIKIGLRNLSARTCEPRRNKRKQTQRNSTAKSRAPNNKNVFFHFYVLFFISVTLLHADYHIIKKWVSELSRLPRPKESIRN